VGTEAFKPVPVNLNDALDQALLHLKSAIAESKAIITRNDAPPRVHLASAREEDCWLI
jgi:hypothetical protein